MEWCNGGALCSFSSFLLHYHVIRSICSMAAVIFVYFAARPLTSAERGRRSAEANGLPALVHPRWQPPHSVKRSIAAERLR
jgi:hypothetical protein